MTRVYANIFYQVDRDFLYNYKEAIQHIEVENFKTIIPRVNGKCLMGGSCSIGVDMLLKRLPAEKKEALLKEFERKFGSDYQVLSVNFCLNLDNLGVRSSEIKSIQ